MVDGPVTNRRFSRRIIRKAVTISASVLVLFVVVGGGWALYSKNVADSEKANREANETMARNIAAQVQKNLGEVKAKLSVLAKDQQTISLFEEGADDAALLAAAEEKQSLFELALKLRFLKPDSYEIDSISVPPLSYASLDMLKKAEITSQVNSEVHMFGTPNQHIVIIERVVNSAFELIGLLHLSLDVSFFDGVAKDIALDNGYAELTQRGSGKTLILTKTGSGGARQGEATTVSVNDTRWIIAYWPGDDEAVITNDGASSPGMPIILIVIVFLLIGGGVYFAMKKKGSSSEAAEDDLIIYQGAVLAIAEVAHPGVEHMIPHLPKGERITANLKPVSQGMTGDDVTMMAGSLSESEAVTEAIDEEPAPSDQNETEKKDERLQIAPVIFRAYDIRGVVDENLTEKAVYEIGKAIGTIAHEQGQQGIVVARDGRVSSPNKRFTQYWA